MQCAVSQHSSGHGHMHLCAAGGRHIAVGHEAKLALRLMVPVDTQTFACSYATSMADYVLLSTK